MRRLMSLDVKYSLTQVLYFGSFSALLGYASVFLLDKGFDNSVIGIVLALVSFIAVFTQPAVASFADNHPKVALRKIVVAFMVIGVILSVLINFFKAPTILLLCIFVGISTVMYTIQPLLNSMAFLFEKYGIEVNFGLARGLGSAAYAVVSFILGYVVEDFGSSVIPLFYLVFNVLLTVVVYTYVIPKNERKLVKKNEQQQEETEQLSFMSFCNKYKKFMIFVLGTVVVFYTHTIINNFFIQVINPIGGTESQMGTAVFLAAIVELPAMGLFNKIREKINCSTLLKISAIFFALKHGLTWIAPNMMFIYIAQVLQIGAYAIFIPASVYYVNQIISEKDAIKGQSMVTMGITASGIFASLSGGILIDLINVNNVLLVGTIVSIIGTLIVLFSVEKVEG